MVRRPPKISLSDTPFPDTTTFRYALEILDVQRAQARCIAGDDDAVADIALFAYASRAEEAGGLSLQPHVHLRAWIERVRAQPGFLAETFPYSIDPHSARDLPSRRNTALVGAATPPRPCRRDNPAPPSAARACRRRARPRRA